MAETKSRIMTRGEDTEALLFKNREQGIRRAVKLIDPEAGFDNKSIDMRVNELPPGSHSQSHRETKEHIMYILKGSGYSLIDGEKFEWQEGDVMYIPRWAWHQYFNTSPDQYARYLVATNTPMVVNLGLDKKENFTGNKD
ncbi:MAG: cupin domain-containing protein [Dehalococcoidales bacterium]|nr:cupin domain-containing protein [Dehalococcoidales bacterium]